jgi:hypothetical protein
MDWQISIDTVTSDIVTEDHIDGLVTILTECGPAVSGGDGRLSVTFTVDEASDALDAIRQGREIWHGALVDIGLTIRDVVDVDVRAATYDEVDAEIARPTIPELWGANEAAEHLGVSRQRIHQLSTSHKTFPVPVVRIGLGPLWTRASIEAFGRSWSRRPGRPNGAAVAAGLAVAATIARGAARATR